MCYQYDFFQEAPDEIDILRTQMIETRNMADNVRKGCFKRINDLSKELIKMKDYQDQMERRLYALEKSMNIRNTDFSLSIEACVGLKSK